MKYLLLTAVVIVCCILWVLMLLISAIMAVAEGTIAKLYTLTKWVVARCVIRLRRGKETADLLMNMRRLDRSVNRALPDSSPNAPYRFLNGLYRAVLSSLHPLAAMGMELDDLTDDAERHAANRKKLEDTLGFLGGCGIPRWVINAYLSPRSVDDYHPLSTRGATQNPQSRPN